MTVHQSHQLQRTHRLKRGILSVLQTPFGPAGEVDLNSLANLVEDAIQSGVDGLLTPAVASEVDYLSPDEREEIVRAVAEIVDQRVPLMVGASSSEIQRCQQFAALAEEVGAAAYLVAVPAAFYGQTDQVVPFFRQVASTSAVPLLIQDLQWNGPGLEIETIAQLRDALSTLVGLKIETVPAGPKYTAVRQKFGDEFFIAGGWAVPQWIEALDRGIDAMIPESAMVRVYAAILAQYRCGQRGAALDLFRQLLPVLSFSNQEIALSVAFFKRLLVRRGVLKSERMRIPGWIWDDYHSRIADELIELYFKLESKSL
jgi:dihydrodipicolinate synthase/N-acetylneuraminate lyase